MSTADVVLSHPWQGHAVNARLTLDEVQARQIVQAGAARYATDESAPADTPAGDEAQVDLVVTGDGTGEALPPADATSTTPRSGRGTGVRGDSATTAATGTVTSD